MWNDSASLLIRQLARVLRWDPVRGKRLAQYQVAGERSPSWTPGRPIISGLGTKTLSLWDRGTAARLHSLAEPTAAVKVVAWQNSGDVLATAAEEKSIRLWDTASGKPLEVVKDLSEPARCLAWSPDGKTLASGGSGHDVRITSATGELLGQLKEHTSSVTALAWSHRGDWLASGGDDQIVALWAFPKMELRHKLSVAQKVPR